MSQHWCCILVHKYNISMLLHLAILTCRKTCPKYITKVHPIGEKPVRRLQLFNNLHALWQSLYILYRWLVVLSNCKCLWLLVCAVYILHWGSHVGFLGRTATARPRIYAFFEDIISYRPLSRPKKWYNILSPITAENRIGYYILSYPILSFR
jgi:hypothetical protein